MRLSKFLQRNRKIDTFILSIIILPWPHCGDLVTEFL